MVRNMMGQFGWGESQELDLGHIHFEMAVRSLSGYVEGAGRDLALRFRTEVWAEAIHSGKSVFR